MTGWIRALLAGALLCALAAGPALAQTSYPTVKIAGRLQLQGYWMDNGDPASRANGAGPESNFFVRRARIQANVQISEFVSAVIQPSFEGGRVSGVRLRDAFVDVRFMTDSAPTLITLRVGQEKRPFGRYELISSTNLPSIERGAGRGMVASASNDIFTRHGYLSHDIGMSLIAAFHDMVTVQVGVYDGRGESQNDNNAAKSFGARGTVAITPRLNVGASIFSHDYLIARPNIPPATGTTPDSSARNTAFGVDAQWNKPGEPGLFLVADYMMGEDTTSTLQGTTRRENNDMRGLSAVAAYHIRRQSPGSYLYAIEPVLRFDRAEPNADVDDDESSLMTAVLGLYFSSKAQLRIGYERQTFADDRPAIQGLRTAMTVNF